MIIDEIDVGDVTSFEAKITRQFPETETLQKPSRFPVSG